MEISQRKSFINIILWKIQMLNTSFKAFTAGRQIYILLLKTKAFLVRVCALDLLLTKIGIFISKTNPLEVDEKITLRCIVYLHFSELLFMDL